MEKQDTECDICRIRHAFMQTCANIVCFTVFYSLGYFLTSTLAYYIDSQVTTLEKQFGFSSSQTGLLVAANDIGFLVFVLLASYTSSIVHVPRSLGASVLLFGTSSLICSLPHFIFGARQSKDLLPVTPNVTSVEKLSTRNSLHDNLCFPRNYSVQSCDTKGGQKAFIPPEHVATVSLVIIFVGMFLQGLAKAPRLSLAFTYLERNTAKVNMIFTAGFIMTANLLGPAAAFLMGRVFSSIYVTLEATNLNPRHPKWIGAWWMGFLFFGCLAVVTSLPLFWFPRRLPHRGTNSKRSVDVKDTLSPEDNTDLLTPRSGELIEKTWNNKGFHETEVKSLETGRTATEKVNVVLLHAKEFLKTVFRLLINPVYLLNTLSSCFQVFAIGGIRSYSAKYFELTFHLTASKANFILCEESRLK